MLARSRREQLQQALVRLPEHTLVRPPEIGMVMLRGRIGGTGGQFNLGEATVTRCAVRVGDRLGVGYILGRDREHAQLVALLDAMLQDVQQQATLLREVIEPLARTQAQARETRSREVAASRVEFFTMVREAA